MLIFDLDGTLIDSNGLWVGRILPLSIQRASDMPALTSVRVKFWVWPVW